LGTHVEAVVFGEADADGLDPGEVAAHGGVVLADEVGVHVEVSVRDDAEVLVLLAVEVEVVAVAARDGSRPRP
jgi:DNA-binding IclR family transcriptional regulator